jgi:hypothetical protein
LITSNPAGGKPVGDLAAWRDDDWRIGPAIVSVGVVVAIAGAWAVIAADRSRAT